MSTVKDKKFPVIVCQSAVDGLTDVERLFIPMLVQKGKLRIVADEKVSG